MPRSGIDGPVVGGVAGNDGPRRASGIDGPVVGGVAGNDGPRRASDIGRLELKRAA